MENKQQPASARVRKWVTELGYADKSESKWRKEAEDYEKIYKGEQAKQNSMNIFWSNTEVLAPALYNSTPEPDVRRRYDDADPIAKDVSLILERALSYEIDKYDLNSIMNSIVLDVLVAGRGIAKVSYDPKIVQVPKIAIDPTTQQPQPILNEETQEPETTDQIESECALVEHIQFDDFRRGQGKTWNKVPWIAFRHRLSKDEVTKQFGQQFEEKFQQDITTALNFDDASDDVKAVSDKQTSENYKTTEIWEIWDKESKTVYFLSKSWTKDFILELEDPLQLDGFFPTPEPIRCIFDTTDLTPIPVYRLYKRQAEELNKVTTRINMIVDALKVRGAYNAQLGEISNVLNAGDNELVPIENPTAIANSGGLENAIWTMPIDKLASVLNNLYAARAQIKQTIYEITGISDVIRGSTNANETATAQQIKAQFGSLRLQRLQREVQRYARDIIRLKGEIICEHFQPQTLQAITGVQIAPEAWNAVIELMKSDQIRDYRIDVETDSTVQESLDNDVKGLGEVLTALSSFFTQVMPLVQMGVLPFEAMKEIALGIVRKSKMGKAVEDQVNQMQPPQPQNTNPTEQEIQQLSQAKETLAKVAEEYVMKNNETLNQTTQLAQKAEMDRQETERLGAVVSDTVAQKATERAMNSELAEVLSQFAETVVKSHNNTMDALNKIAQVVSAPKAVQFSKDAEGRITGAAAMPITGN